GLRLHLRHRLRDGRLLAEDRVDRHREDLRGGLQPRRAAADVVARRIRLIGAGCIGRGGHLRNVQHHAYGQRGGERQPVGLRQDVVVVAVAVDGLGQREQRVAGLYRVALRTAATVAEPARGAQHVDGAGRGGAAQLLFADRFEIGGHGAAAAGGALLQQLAAGGIGQVLGLRDAVDEGAGDGHLTQVVVAVAGGDGAAATGRHFGGGAQQQAVLLHVGVLVTHRAAGGSGIQHGTFAAGEGVVAQYVAVGIVAIPAGSGVAVLGDQVQRRAVHRGAHGRQAGRRGLVGGRIGTGGDVAAGGGGLRAARGVVDHVLDQATIGVVAAAFVGAESGAAGSSGLHHRELAELG